MDDLMMPRSPEDVVERVNYLKELHRTRDEDKRRVRAIMNGGPEGLAALLGAKARNQSVPVANFMLSGLNRLSQKLARLPDLKVDPPRHRDSEAAQKSAEKRERIVAGYDEAAKLDLMMPQLTKWLPGYAFTPLVLSEGRDQDGQPFPMVELRDPYDAYPAEWGVQQQPEDIAFIREVSRRRLVAKYPDHAGTLLARDRATGAVLLDRGRGGWETGAASGDVVEVAEYYDRHGMWLVVPGCNLILEHTPTPLASGQSFYVIKRFAFDRLVGHYDHVIELMVSMAKMNLLSLIAMEDAVHAPTDIVGGVAGHGVYKRGRGAINFLDPGSSVSRTQANLPYQMFDQINRMERQFRVTAGYSVTDDGQSPNSFATGRGLDELKAGVDLEVKEYQTAIRRGLEAVDAKRLEWDEREYRGMRKTVYGQKKGDRFSETYVPVKDISGRYKTRRVYGVMAGWDDQAKVVTGLQLLQGDIIDTQTMQENIDGLEDITLIRKRIRAEKAEGVAMDSLLAMAQQGDPAALMAAIEMMPEGEAKRALAKFYTPQEPQMSPEEEAMVAPPADAPPLPSEPPDVATVLSRLTGAGEVQGGVQTVGRL